MKSLTFLLGRKMYKHGDISPLIICCTAAVNNYLSLRLWHNANIMSYAVFLRDFIRIRSDQQQQNKTANQEQYYLSTVLYI